MTSDAVYLVDANVLIEAKNRYYSFAICPGFWDVLVRHARSGALRSIDRVKAELAGGNDDLAEWVKSTAPGDAFGSTNDVDAVGWYVHVVNWVLGEPRFTPAAKDEFAQAADPWLVAYAGAHGMAGHAGDSRANGAQQREDPRCLPPVRGSVAEHVRDV